MDVLINKTYKKYDRVSRYGNFPYYYNVLDDKYVYGTTAYLDDSTPYTLHKVTPNDTLDTLALDYYGNPTFFWVIADFNRIQDPCESLEKFEYIKIPSFSNLVFKA